MGERWSGGLTYDGMIARHLHCGPTLSIDERVRPTMNGHSLPGVTTSWGRGQRRLSKGSKNRHRHVEQEIVTREMEVSSGLFKPQKQIPRTATTTDMQTPRVLQEEMIGHGKKILRSTTWIRRR